MSTNLKFLYEFTVLRQIEEKVTESKEENGEKFEIVKTIKKSKPVKVAILEPRRKLFEGAEIFYAKQIAQYIQGGLLPYSLVAKRYANDGGALSEPEKENLLKLRNEATELQSKLFTLEGTEEEKTKIRGESIVKINQINAEINSIQNTYADIFENTAEVKARNKTIEWWVLYLSYIEDEKGYKPLFNGNNHEEKLSDYDKLDEQQDEFTSECIKKLSYLIAFWFSARVKISKEEFAAMDKIYQESLSEYTVEDSEKEILAQ